MDEGLIVGDCMDDHFMRVCQEGMCQKISGIEIFVCKVDATQIKTVLVARPNLRSSLPN